MKVTRAPAQTLLEIMLYCALLSMLILYVFRFYTMVHNFVIQEGAAYDVVCRQAIAIDLMRREILSASSKPAEWDDKKNVFKKTYLDVKGNWTSISVGYTILKNRLYRIEGNYNFVQSLWVQKRSCCIGAGFEKIDWQLLRNELTNSIRGITVSYKCKNKKKDTTDCFYVNARRL